MYNSIFFKMRVIFPIHINYTYLTLSVESVGGQGGDTTSKSCALCRSVVHTSTCYCYCCCCYSRSRRSKFLIVQFFNRHTVYISIFKTQNTFLSTKYTNCKRKVKKKRILIHNSPNAFDTLWSFLLLIQNYNCL